MSEFDAAIDKVVQGEPVDWLAMHAAADQTERTRLVHLQALEQMARALTAADTNSPDVAGVPRRTTLAADQHWGHLELREQLGRGAFGVVYEAWDATLARTVALKLLHGLPASTSEEARRLARVRHPNVVTIYGVDRHDGVDGIWMERLQGQTLEEALADRGPFSAREAILVGLDICTALAAIHAAGLIHRDVKTQNVIRESGGRLVLTDFGASIDVTAQLDATLAGTPLYMAPELFTGSQASVASDVYAVGVLLYRLVAHAFPVAGQTVGDIRSAHAQQTLRALREVRPDLPSDFVALVDRALARDPADRFPSAARLESALRESLGLPQSVRKRTWTSRIGLVLVVVAAAALGSAPAWWRTTTRSDPAPAPLMDAGTYKLFSGYEQLAFEKRVSAPEEAREAIAAAFSLARASLKGDEPIFALLNERLTDVWLNAGRLDDAKREHADSKLQIEQSVGTDHPYAVLHHLGSASIAQKGGDLTTAAREVIEALAIRWRILGLSRLNQRAGPTIDSAAVERALASAPLVADIDGDGLLDVVERAALLNPAAPDTDGDGLMDADEDHDEDGVPNRLALGAVADPFTVLAHFGSYEPRRLLWRWGRPFSQRPVERSGWAIETESGQALLTQILPVGVRARALSRGFRVLARVAPSAGTVFVSTDGTPFGPRFDIAVRRRDDSSVEVSLLSSVIPLEGWTRAIPAAVGDVPPLLELTYRPDVKSATLHVDGGLVGQGYEGHRHYQEGVFMFGVMAVKTDVLAKAAFQLVWLEVF